MSEQEKKQAKKGDRPSPFVTAVGIGTIITALLYFAGMLPWPIHQLCIAAGFGYGAVDAQNPKGKAAFALGAALFVIIFITSLLGGGQ